VTWVTLWKIWKICKIEISLKTFIKFFLKSFASNKSACHAVKYWKDFSVSLSEAKYKIVSIQFSCINQLQKKQNQFLWLFFFAKMQCTNSPWELESKIIITKAFQNPSKYALSYKGMKKVLLAHMKENCKKLL